MQFQLEKYGFRIRTRSGGIVDNLSIHAAEPDAAEQKLRRMYPGCQILESWNERARLGPQATSFEEVIDLIAPSRV